MATAAVKQQLQPNQAGTLVIVTRHSGAFASHYPSIMDNILVPPCDYPAQKHRRASHMSGTTTRERLSFSVRHR